MGLVDENVCGEGWESRSDFPDVEVMDLEDAVTAWRSRSMAATSVPRVAASRKIRHESRIRPHPALAISTATMSAATASARAQPVSRMIRPAMAVAMKANRSLRMCWNRAFDVQAGPVGAGDEPAGGEVDDDTDQSRDQDQAAGHLGRVDEPLDAFVGEPCGERPTR